MCRRVTWRCSFQLRRDRCAGALHGDAASKLRHEMGGGGVDATLHRLSLIFLRRGWDAFTCEDQVAWRGLEEQHPYVSVALGSATSLCSPYALCAPGKGHPLRQCHRFAGSFVEISYYSRRGLEACPCVGATVHAIDRIGQHFAFSAPLAYWLIARQRLCGNSLPLCVLCGGFRWGRADCVAGCLADRYADRFASCRSWKPTAAPRFTFCGEFCGPFCFVQPLSYRREAIPFPSF